MANNDLRLKIYGVRGSYPPPNSNATRFGVNTTCLRFDIGKHVVIIDAGTGIMNLGADLVAELKAGKSKQNIFKLHLLFTHSHIDHLMGFPYFNMLYMPQTELHIISPTLLNYSTEDIIETWMSPAFFPVTVAELPSSFSYYHFGEFKQLYFFEDDFRIVSVNEAKNTGGWIGRISCLRNFTHPKGGSYSYKLENIDGKSMVFATDIEGFPGGDQRLIKFAQNAKVLIHDAQYSPSEYKMFQGFGHSTFEMAVEVAQKAAVEKLILIHHDPNHSDEQLTELENKAQAIFSETYMAAESMEFTL